MSDRTHLPRSILLATDLDGRCDRALDRAAALAREWNARLVVLTVVEPEAEAPPRRGEPPRLQASEAALRASERLHRDAGAAVEGLEVELLVREGPVGPAIAEVASAMDCGLLVTGVAHDALFGRHVVGSTVDWLARQGGLPLLVVRDRPHAPYARVVVASDLSDGSAPALLLARNLFPRATATLFHAFQLPYLGLRDGDRDGAVERGRDQAIADARTFLDRYDLPAIAPSVAYGDTAATLREFATTQRADLVVAATRGRGALYHLLIGSAARDILDASPCDTLLVPDPGSRDDG